MFTVIGVLWMRTRSVETLLADLRHAGFPNVALLTDMTAMQTWESYLWDEQEKYVQQMKSQQTCISSSHPPLRCLMRCAQ